MSHSDPLEPPITYEAEATELLINPVADPTTFMVWEMLTEMGPL
jgi:hypothetical protein